MKKILRVSAAAMAAVMLLSACGKKEEDQSQNATTTTTGATINYEDYITPVVDRKIKDCISVEQINALLDELWLSYDMVEDAYFTDSTVNYSSADGRTISLALENMTEEAFAAIAANPAAGWIQLTELGDAAYWNGDQTELIAYKNGYAFSMSVQNIANAAMVGIADIVLDNLGE